MADILTLAQMRDEVRRMLGINPPIDTIPTATAGQQPTGNAAPTNPQINSAINQAVSLINTMSGFNESVTSTLAVTATANDGPLYTSLSTTSTPITNVNSVERAVWDDGVSPIVQLVPSSVYEQDRSRMMIDEIDPGTPVYYWITGYQIALLPPPNVNGTIRMYCTVGIASLKNDSDTIPADLPGDYQTGIIIKAARDLSGRMYGAGDANGIKARTELYNGEWNYWSLRIEQFVQGISAEYQPSLIPATRRLGISSMRVRR